MKALKHILEQPFVAATGFAALIHSTWSLATLFAGHEPSAAENLIAWVFWVAPALLIALTVDIGQVVTASEIRAGQRSRVKFATFAVFAIATYFLQWYHLVHHMPVLMLSAGVRADWQGFAQFLADSMIWIIPGLLPASTLLYTFSHKQPVQLASVQPVQPVQPVQTPVLAVQNTVQVLQPVLQSPAQQPAQVQAPVQETLQESPAQPLQLAEHAPDADMVLAACPFCDWSKPCTSQDSATKSLNAHLRFCKAKVQVEATS